MNDHTLRATAIAVALAGLGVAAYLTWVHYAGSSVLCVSGGCETVQTSEYATIAGVPVAALGMVAYAAMLVLLAWDSTYARLGAATIALAGLLFSVYLLVLQLFVIEAICIWCLANDVVVAPALAVLTGARLRS